MIEAGANPDTLAVSVGCCIADLGCTISLQAVIRELRKENDAK